MNQSLCLLVFSFSFPAGELRSQLLICVWMKVPHGRYLRGRRRGGMSFVLADTDLISALFYFLIHKPLHDFTDQHFVYFFILRDTGKRRTLASRDL